MSIAVLYCWIHGDKQYRVFPVEIATTKTVAVLKEAIKEKNKHGFQDIDAKTLDLWKVSIPLKDVKFRHKLENLDLADELPLSAWLELSSVFPDKPRDDHLSIVIDPVGERDSFSVFVMIPDLTSFSQKRGF